MEPRKPYRMHALALVSTVTLLTSNTLWYANRKAPPKAPPPRVFTETAAVQVCFSPHGGCTDFAVAQIAAAKRQIKLLSYTFTSAPIAAALLDAQKRGVDVVVINDKHGAAVNGSVINLLFAAKLHVYLDGAHAIAHNKIMIVDGLVVLTGSFNWTNAAEARNAENLLAIQDLEVVQHYLQNFDVHLGHADRMTSPLPTGPTE